MKISKQNFISKHWKPKETQFITIYTKTSPNLGCDSTQRAESTHPVITTLLNHQLSLAEAVKRLNHRITTLLQDLEKVESVNYGVLPRTFDLGVYTL